ncbi:drug/metabolite transporter (DMT)-like permease [Frondihabitans australicus]|uniref:Drug/metabolite transporter (DMT)-like permease n=1 Tax=Frondihabitans australicus TaxID=386892 RepID=A0A495IBK2_9MICO|nr:drug/metabolite transporter (DMT)-like permease [Frondihabitans australicus]
MASLVSRSRVDLLLLVVAVSWGSTYLVAKELLSADAVVALLAVRLSLAGILLCFVTLIRGRGPDLGEIGRGSVLGLVLATVFAFETFGILHTSATNAGVLISLTIVFTPALDAVVSRRLLPPRFLAAAGLAVVGVVLLSGGGLRGLSLGDGLILVAAVVRAVHVTLTHRMTAHRTVDSVSMTAIQLLTCGIVFSLASVFFGVSLPHFVGGLGLRQIVLLGYLVLLCTVFAFLVQTWAVRRTSPSRVSLLLGTEPVWAAVIGIVIAHDRVGVAGYLGIALILLGALWGRRVEGSSGDGTARSARGRRGAGGTTTTPSLVPESRGAGSSAVQHARLDVHRGHGLCHGDFAECVVDRGECGRVQSGAGG